MSNEPRRDDDYVPQWKRRRASYYIITVRCAAAAYVLYMGYVALKKALAGEEGISLPLAIGISVVFLVAAAGMLIYSWRQWSELKKESAQAKNTLPEVSEEPPVRESDEPAEAYEEYDRESDDEVSPDSDTM